MLWKTIYFNSCYIMFQVYQVAYVIFKAANSPRPGNWILERSIDGQNYMPWQYYSVSDSDCWNTYGIAPTIGIPRYKSDSEVICTSYYSRLDPLVNGEVCITVFLTICNCTLYQLVHLFTFKPYVFSFDQAALYMYMKKCIWYKLIYWSVSTRVFVW